MRAASVLHRGVTLFGAFNPAVVTPEWLRSVGLVQDDVALKLTVISTVGGQSVGIDAPWFSLEVSPATFVARTGQDERFEDLVLLVSQVFMLLRHTPVDAVACSAELSIGSDAAAPLMQRLAPSAPWETRAELLERRLAVDVRLTDGTLVGVTLTADRAHSCRLSVVLPNSVDEEHVGAERAVECLAAVSGRYRKVCEQILSQLLPEAVLSP